MRSLKKEMRDLVDVLRLFLIFHVQVLLPMPEEFYSMDNLESNRRFRQILKTLSKFLIFFLFFYNNFQLFYQVHSMHGIKVETV